MAKDESKTLRIAAVLTLLFSLALAAQSFWALKAYGTVTRTAHTTPGVSAGHAPSALAIAGLLLAVAAALGALWTLFLAAGIARKLQDVYGPAEDRSIPAAIPAIQPAAPPRQERIASEPGSEALMLLSLLQEKGRFVDFVMDDIAAYTNDQVGAAARVVHQGCREVILEAFAPLPVAPIENAQITLEPGYDAGEFRLVGRAPASPPLTVKVTHKGWRARHVKLPRNLKTEKVPEKPIIVPAEVAA